MTDSVFNQEMREKVFANVVSTVARRLYDPALNGVDWNAAAAKHRGRIIGAGTAEEFESAVNNLIKELRVSHAGFFSEKRPLAAAKIAIGATFHNGGSRWIFQDVHPGGPAHAAGVQPGDTLLAVAGKDAASPQMPVFALGEAVAVNIERRNGRHERLQILVPVSKKKNRPLVEIQPASWTKLPDGTGYLKVAIFPGRVGIILPATSTGLYGS